ncbi:GGDEF domain-containing protein [Catenulispora sp. NF23]|uniref:GGDEF domain-containing protein n=1 Tax=Catenulispora pinistramenti TaxID=2705254 RepID=A0ABS5KH48_9ACTN|nr:GGDEF domain-containing protein [Catenulispora pinistramenti]MBS2532369.1 GGDEF domain-containing protein [Catenulispora pinistramenti]MBS2545564.1 GGDEF domain-containing protein [Catenulispora pinistramenti]
MSLTALGLVLLAVACLALAGLNLALRRRLEHLEESTRTALAEAASEVTGLEQGREDLERLSALDPLTGVWNYRHLQGMLARELEAARTTGIGGALLMIDVDDFRQVNAAHGHQRGSAVLRELAQRLALEVRHADTFARYGGEEFVLILPGTNAETATKVAERLCYAVRKLTFDAGPDGDAEQGPFQLTISVGGVIFPDHGTHAATLLRVADEQLMEAKRDSHGSWRIT